MFLVDHAISTGLSGVQAAATVTIISGSSAVIRVVMAVIMMAFPNLNPMHIITISCVGSALCSISLPMTASPAMVYSVCVLYGVCLGMYNVALGVGIVQMFGKKKSTGAISYVLIASGVGALITTFIGGKHNALRITIIR